MCLVLKPFNMRYYLSGFENIKKLSTYPNLTLKPPGMKEMLILVMQISNATIYTKFHD